MFYNGSHFVFLCFVTENGLRIIIMHNVIVELAKHHRPVYSVEATQAGTLSFTACNFRRNEKIHTKFGTNQRYFIVKIKS